MTWQMINWLIYLKPKTKLMLLKPVTMMMMCKWFEEFRLPGFPKKHEDQSANGVGASSAVVDQLIPGVVPGHSLVLFEGIDEILEWFTGQIVASDGF